MRWMRSILGRVNNRKAVMSLLAVGVGVTALGITQRRRLNGNAWRQMLRPVRKMF
ncbi:hypothetical protein PaeBR_12925 [Paenibacillus sp. BR2-3]|uniref:hypothetical protein n=1 Tax=Paenibacillus sp. BR2-3 TaxID=3048494 RepID=UPI003977AFFC